MNNKRKGTTPKGLARLGKYSRNKNWVYFGGNEPNSSHRNKWKLFCLEIGRDPTKFPKSKDHCMCEHTIRTDRNCYIYCKSNDDKHRLKVVGSCCIKRFEFKYRCWDCGETHKNTSTTRCNKCR